MHHGIKPATLSLREWQEQLLSALPPCFVVDSVSLSAPKGKPLSEYNDEIPLADFAPCVLDGTPPSARKFSVRVVHTGADPLGDLIPGDHAFFTMLSCHERGALYLDLGVGEGGCVRRSTTADGRYVENRRTHPVLYSVTRVQ